MADRLEPWERKAIERRREQEIEAEVNRRIGELYASGMIAPPTTKSEEPKLRRSTMSPSEKARFMTEHSPEEYVRLPW